MKALLIISICILASCVEPPRIPVQTEDGIVHLVRRPSYKTNDTILLVTKYNYILEIGPTTSIVGNYIGTVPERDSINGIAKYYSIATIIK